MSKFEDLKQLQKKTGAVRLASNTRPHFFRLCESSAPPCFAKALTPPLPPPALKKQAVAVEYRSPALPFYRLCQVNLSTGKVGGASSSVLSELGTLQVRVTTERGRRCPGECCYGCGDAVLFLVVLRGLRVLDLHFRCRVRGWQRRE